MKRVIATVAVVGVLIAGGVNVASGADVKTIMMRQRIRYLEARMSGAEARIDGLAQILHQAQIDPKRVITASCEPGDPAVWVGEDNIKPGPDVHLSC